MTDPYQDRGQYQGKGQKVDPAGAAKMPLPTPAPEESNLQRMYWDLLNRYNDLYNGLRGMLKSLQRIEPNTVLTEEALLAEVGAVFREVERATVNQSMVIEEDKAQRTQWQRHETRWRALTIAREGGLHGDAGSRSVDQWITNARRIAQAVESDDFG